MTNSKFKFYIGIPAYHAENTIGDVLRRTCQTGFIEKIIVVDDCSPDHLSDIVKKFDNTILVTHSKNTGYGGAQKTIYDTFLNIAKNSNDVIVLLHADGQTLPEELPLFGEKFMDPRVDIVLGSRAMGNTRKGNMPRYRIAGDRVLTWLQNAAFDLKLSTYASGYRGFRKRALASIKYHDLKNQHSFDSEIIVRAKESNQKMVEIPVSTIYKGEKSHYNLIKYGLQVIALAAGHFFKRIFGLSPPSKYNGATNKNYWVNAKHDWYQARTKGNPFEKTYFWLKGNKILGHVDYEDKVVLDCGCGTGVYTFDLAKKARQVFGLDISPWAVETAIKRDGSPNAHFLVGDADNLPFADNSFDLIVHTAVLQYYPSPQQMINEINRVLKPSGKVISEVPYKYGWYRYKWMVRYLTSKRDFGQEPVNRCYSKNEFKGLFTDFHVIKITNFANFLLFGIFQKPAEMEK